MIPHPFKTAFCCEACFAYARVYLGWPDGEKAGEVKATAAVAAVALPCVHQGEELLAREIRAAGRDPRRRTFVCRRMRGNPAGVVQPCVDCSSTCPDFRQLEQVDQVDGE